MQSKNPYIKQQTKVDTQSGASKKMKNEETVSQNINRDNPYLNNQNPYYYNNTNNSVNSGIMNQINPPSSNPSLFDSFDTSNFLKGAAIGAIGAYLLTNENAQKTIFKTLAKGTEMFQAGIEEMKERFEDAKAEMEAER